MDRRLVGRMAAAAALGLSAGSAWAGGGSGVWIGSAPSAAGEETGAGVWLDTSAARPAGTLARALESADRAGEPRGARVVQVSGGLTAGRRAALEAAGLRVRGALPRSGFVVDPRGADARAVAGLGFVRWHAAVERSWKVSPELGELEFATPERRALAAAGRGAYVVTLLDAGDRPSAVAAIASLDASAVVDHAMANADGSAALHVEMDAGLVRELADVSEVLFIEEAPEATFRNTTSRSVVQSGSSGATPIYDRGIRGAGQIVGVMDGTIEADHCSFIDPEGDPFGPLHRKIVGWNTTSTVGDVHGTHVGATVAGDAGSANDTRGVAYEARIAFGRIPGSLSDSAMYAALAANAADGARIHTNSWGDDSTTSYNALARGCDRYMHDNEDDLVIFAVTNTATLKNPDNAKNILAVGATRDWPSIDTHCSGGIGPTADGRRKPEIYAPGCGIASADQRTSCGTVALTGTSMAAPAIAGAAALARQYYTEGFYPSGSASASDGFTPSGALLKATLINGTRDMTGVSGYPSSLEGWGRLVLDDVLRFAGEEHGLFVSDVRNAAGLSGGESSVYTVTASGTTEPVRITLAWTDPPAGAFTGTGPAWINDLDLRVTDPVGNVYWGNAVVNGESVSASAGGTKDDRNNVERVIVGTPIPGDWTVEVIGAGVSSGPQGYALVATTPDPAVAPLALIATPGAPASVLPGEAVEFGAFLFEGDDELVPGSATVWVRSDGGAFGPIGMSSVDGSVFTATAAGFGCGSEPEYYFAAEGVSTGPVRVPESGAFGLLVGELVTLFADDGETDLGWSVSGDAAAGVWSRGAPTAFVRGNPNTDADGSGQAWLTDPSGGPMNDGNTDVDDGTTLLTSPVLDVSDGATVRWSYWFNDVPNGPRSPEDVMTVESSLDGGATWSVIRTYTDVAGSWRSDAWEAPGTSELRLRFGVGDLGAQNVIEAGLDAVLVEGLECVTPPPACPGDADGNGATDVSDFFALSGSFGTASGASRADGDVTGDGAVDVADFFVLAGDFGCGG